MRHFVHEALFFAADGFTDDRRSAAALADDEAEHQAVLLQVAFVDQHRVMQHVLGRKSAAAGFAQQPAQGHTALLHQRQAKFVHVLEVPVERGRNDADFAGYFAQTQRGKAAALADQIQRRLHQLLTGLQFAGVAASAGGERERRRTGQIGTSGGVNPV